MADSRYTGAVNLTIPSGTGIRLIGEVGLDLEESLVPVYAEAGFSLAGALSAAPETAYVFADSAGQGDEYLISRAASVVEDGTEQGDEVTLGTRVLLVVDGTQQGDEITAFGIDTVTVIDGTEQGDEHSLPVTRSLSSGIEQGDAHSLVRFSIPIIDGNEQADEVAATAKALWTVIDGTAQGDEFVSLGNRILLATDGTAQGDEAALVPPAIQIIQDGTQQGDEVLSARWVTQTIEDGSAQNDTFELLGLRVRLVEDGLFQGDEFLVARTGFVRTVLVVNADSGAVNRYQFDKNLTGASLADDVLLLSSTTGLYALDGDSDGGTAISWVLDTGNTHLGTPYLKRLAYVDVLHRTDGEINFRLISAKYGVKRSDQYLIPARTRSSYRDGRVKVGKGINSVYYGMGLTGSGMVEIDAIQIDVEKLSRRR